MAKKKRKKRPQTRPQAAGGATTAHTARPEPAAPAEADRPSNRQLRKEQARIERERRLRQARRRLRTRRLLRWGVPILVIGALVAFFVWQRFEQSRAVAEAADLAGCSEIQDSDQDFLAEAPTLTSQQIHSEPFAEGTGGIPATAGRHASPLPADPAVYDQPVPEENAVHNLEHGYVLIYYASEGENALSDDLRLALESYANGEDKTIMAPYEGLANTVDFVAWGKLRTCDPPPDADPDDLLIVARDFADQFKSGGLAPEPNGV